MPPPLPQLHFFPHAPAQPPAILAIGQFDGIHPGHRAVLQTAARLARQTAAPSATLTFSPPPEQILFPNQPPAALATDAENYAAILACGIDAIAILPFTPALAATPPPAFLQQLKASFPALRTIVTGWNFTFGHNAAGTAARLPALAAPLGLSACVVPPVQYNGAPIASSRIRAALRAGNIPLATALLGRPFTLSGRVIHGRAIGRRIGFPTANIRPHPLLLLPRPGVYAASLQIAPDQPPRPAAAFLPDPQDPTQQAAAGAIEVHLPNFTGNLYGQSLTLGFRRRLRGHQNFHTLAALASQLHRDIALIQHTENGEPP